VSGPDSWGYAASIARLRHRVLALYCLSMAQSTGNIIGLATKLTWLATKFDEIEGSFTNLEQCSDCDVC
jgi:hypothetical protein